MNWMIFALGAALSLAAADIMVKLAAGKLPTSLGLLLYGSVPFVTGLTWFLVDKSKKVSMSAPPQVLAIALGVGVAFTLVTVALYAAFQKGAPISLASPLIRLGGLVVASAAGFILWKEPLSGRYLLGMALSFAGIFLILKR